MEINAAKEKNALIVSVKGKIDAISAPEFEKQLEDWMNQGETDFIINLDELDYISSAGLRSVLVTAKKLKVKNGRIFLAALTDVVKDVFDISGFSSIIPIYESVESALAEM